MKETVATQSSRSIISLPTIVDQDNWIILNRVGTNEAELDKFQVVCGVSCQLEKESSSNSLQSQRMLCATFTQLIRSIDAFQLTANLAEIVTLAVWIKRQRGSREAVGTELSFGAQLVSGISKRTIETFFTRVIFGELIRKPFACLNEGFCSSLLPRLEDELRYLVGITLTI